MNTIFWSVTIPCFNAAAFIGETLESVLLQDRGEEKMEIVVIDNCSTDNTLDIVRQIGKGRVKIIVNDRNVGMFGNFNKCIEHARGEVIHLLNSDDLVKPGFYQRFEEVFAANPEAHLVCCNVELIDEHGVVKGETQALKSLKTPTTDLSELTYGNHIYTPSVVVRKKAYAQLGGFDAQFHHVGDWEMWARVIFNLKGMYIDDVLAQYREHSQNGTITNRATGNDIVDFEKIFNKFIALGYPIDKVKVEESLRNVSKGYYMLYTYAGNKIAAANMLLLFKRHASAVESTTLVATTSLRKLLSRIKQTLKGKK